MCLLDNVVVVAGEPNDGHQLQQEEHMITSDGFSEKSKEFSPGKITRPSFSFELLKSHGKGFKRKMVKSRKSSMDIQVSDSAANRSVEELVRIAGARYVQFCELKYDDFSMVMHPFGYALSGDLTDDETKDVELFHLLLAAAEKVANRQWDRACRILARCEWMSSEKSNAVQRVVGLFVGALRERIDDKAAASATVTAGKILDNGLGTSATHLRLYQKLQFLHVTYFAGIQAIVEEVASARNIHVLDLEIRSGVQWTILMQAIKDERRDDHCPVLESLTITAVQFSGDSRSTDQLKATGNRLLAFAESLNFPLSFKVASFPWLKGPKSSWVTLMDISAGDETVVVFAPLMLRTMLAKPSLLEMLMRVMIRRWNPSLMILIEVEANHNVADFSRRFIEVLFFYSALFDCVGACLGQETAELREEAEEVFGGGIRNMVVKDEEERVVRSVKLDVWRAFLGKFGMTEQQMSDPAFYQASLLIREMASSDSYTLLKDGKSFVVGWKGTPIHSVSAWKFTA